MRYNRYYLHQFVRDKWHIIDRLDNLPVYDDERDGKDAPLVFTDSDAAIQCLDKLNEDSEPIRFNEKDK